MDNIIKVLKERIKMLDNLYASAKKTSKYPEQWHSNTDDLKEAIKAIKENTKLKEKLEKLRLYSFLHDLCNDTEHIHTMHWAGRIMKCVKAIRGR